MSITLNTIGANSRQIVVSGEVGPVNIIAAINTSLTDLGQTLHDTVVSGSLNCYTCKVYSAPNNDAATGGPTYKYLILRFDAPRQQQYSSCAENQNNTTHVATNECFTNGRSVPLPLQYDNCTLYVFASSRYAAFLGNVSAEQSAWQGVFEFEREAPEDTATLGYPCFGQTTSLNIGEAWAGSLGAATSTYGSLPYVFSVPRTRTGNTGFGAITEFTIHTAFGMYPPNSTTTTLYGTSGGLTATVNTHNGHLGAFNQGYRQDGGKKIASSLKLGGFTIAYPTGRVYGLTVIPPTGAVLDTVVIPYDAGKNFFSTDGTNVNTFVLPISGGYADTPSIVTNGLVSTTFSGGPAYTVNKVELIKGRIAYMATSGGIVKLDLGTGVYTTISTANTPIQDVRYDGGLYMYFSTVAGVTRLAVADDSLTNLACGTGGTAALEVDDTYVYATHRTAATTPKMDVITAATFTVARTYTSTYTMAIAQTQTALCTADYNGYVYASNPISSSSNTNDVRIFKILGSDGSSTHTLPTQRTVSCTGGFMFWDGYLIMLCYSAATVSINGILPTTLADGIVPVSFAATSPYTRTGYLNCIYPYKGYYVVPNLTSTKLGAFYNRLNQANITSIPVFSATANYMTISTIGTPSAGTTDCCSMITGAACNSFFKITNNHNIYNNAGQPTANILIPS